MALLDLLGFKNNEDNPENPTGENPELLVNYVDEEFKRRQDERQSFELIWRLNMAFMEGNQYVDVNTAGMTLEEVPKMYWWQERECVNLVAPNVETRIAKLSRMRPILKCRPGSGEQQDLRAAKVGNYILKNIYNDEQMTSKLDECFIWMEVCGSAFSKNVWDPNKGPLVAEMFGETGEKQTLKEGDLDVIMCPAPEIFPDSCYNQTIEACRSIIHAKTYHIDEIEETWGKKVEPEESVTMQLQKTITGGGGLGYGGGGFLFKTTKLKHHAIVKEYWEIPTKKFPEGRLIIVANKTLLHNGPLPYKVGMDQSLALPFCKVDCISRPGVFWGRTVLERMVPLQRRYNSLRNRKAEYLNRCAIGQWIVEDGSVDLEILESEAGAPGAIIPYQRGYNPPRQSDNPQLPVAFETEERAILSEFSIVSGVSELSRQSTAPAGVKSGVALSIALEQDDTRLSQTSGNIEEFLIANGKQWLRMYKQFVQGVRTLRNINRNNLVELIDWTSATIRSDDVGVESFSALAESPAQRRQLAFDLLNTPLIMDPDTGRISKEMQARVLEMIELNQYEDSQDDATNLHINKAERENKQMEQGMQALPVDYDDHILHINRHNKYRLTTDYEKLLMQYPQIDLVFSQHVYQHMTYMMPAPETGTEPGAEETQTGEPGTEEQPTG